MIDWRWHRIRGELLVRGITLVSIAREAGVSRAAVSQVRRQRSERIERAIARRLGVPPSVIWPSRYRGLDRVA